MCAAPEDPVVWSRNIVAVPEQAEPEEPARITTTTTSTRHRHNIDTTSTPRTPPPPPSHPHKHRRITTTAAIQKEKTMYRENNVGETHKPTQKVFTEICSYVAQTACGWQWRWRGGGVRMPRGDQAPRPMLASDAQDSDFSSPPQKGKDKGPGVGTVHPRAVGAAAPHPDQGY